MGVLTEILGRARIVATLATVWLLVARTAVATPYRLRIGDTIPDLELPRLEGGSLRLSSLRGRVVALSFYSPYCEPCRRELPTLQRAVERAHRGRSKAIDIVVIVTEDRPPPEVVREHATARWLLEVANQAEKEFDPRTLPCTYLIDARGTVRHINRGFGPGYQLRIEKWLRAMVARGQ